jgi:putative N-acetylmannosamine-6-phosphate epimerase/predicted NBD/HSP70 family sugar kinase
MTLREFLDRVARQPLIASVQASEGSPVDDPEVLLRLAMASIQEGVQILRLQGVQNIEHIKPATGVPVIGLIKRSYPDSEVYITPTLAEVGALLDQGCEVVALDGTSRARPSGAALKDLVDTIHRRGALAMADCDTYASAAYAKECGADLIGTTLAGYTSDSPNAAGPDFEFLRALHTLDTPFVAEGRFAHRWEVEAALRIGACSVVVGGALNDPIKQTRVLAPRRPKEGERVGAVDIGGTWLRFGVFDSNWKLLKSDRVKNPPLRAERIEWIKMQAERHKVARIGLGTGGIVDPSTGICWAAKENLMPDQIGIEFSERTLGVPSHAHGDGHATAWGHACLPQFAGLRVATLALGTGVGCGCVQEGRIWSGRRGEYPRINDLPTSDGRTFEEVLGGIYLQGEPTDDQKSSAIQALEDAVFAVRNLYFPDVLVIGGSVGLSDWIRPRLDELDLVPSPFGTDAGLYGAAALALYPPN